MKYSLVQHLHGRERTVYKGVTVKLIRLAVQWLVLIVPWEEQLGARPITEEKKLEAKRISDQARGLSMLHLVHDHPPGVVNTSYQHLYQGVRQAEELWGKVIRMLLGNGSIRLIIEEATRRPAGEVHLLVESEEGHDRTGT